MIDIVDQINATHRELADRPLATGPGRSVLLRRSYPASVDEVWDACTEGDRIARWLGPVTGDLRRGGEFHLEGNASGEILTCEHPRLLVVTWVLGEGMASEVELRLAPGGEGETVLELEHSAPAEIVDELLKAYGPGGTIGLGTGWDLALLGLDRHLGGEPLDPTTWEDTPEARAFATGASVSWGRAIQGAWHLDDATIEAAVAFATAHYAPER